LAEAKNEEEYHKFHWMTDEKQTVWDFEALLCFPAKLFRLVFREMVEHMASKK
jgi:hypothetical protein